MTAVDDLGAHLESGEALRFHASIRGGGRVGVTDERVLVARPDEITSVHLGTIREVTIQAFDWFMGVLSVVLVGFGLLSFDRSVLGGLLFVAFGLGNLYWTYRKRGQVQLHLHNRRKAITFSLDADDEFQAALGDAVNTTPVVHGGRVYATTPERVVALDAEDGTGRWLGTVDHVAKTGLGVGGGMVHVGGNEVAAFATDGGTPEWRVELPGVAGTFGSPLYVDGTLYAGGCVKTEGNSRYDHTVWALE
jgi:outer membrane protein assembly factor BamB